MYRYRESCRACGSKELVPVLNLGVQPLANEFVLPSEPHSGYAPLEVMFCPRCTLGQLSVVVDPAILYSEYRYVTSQSEMMFRHFEKITADIQRESGKDSSLVEIGSNDGTFLVYALHHGFGPVCGVDPAANLAQLALQYGINTVVRQFGTPAAALVAEFMPKVDVVLARHVFCHIDDWRGIICGLDVLSHKDTLVCIEVPDTEKMLANVEFDTIYHEHLSYLTVRSVIELLNGTNWHVHKVLRYSIHGGALMIMLRRNEWKERDSSVDAFEIGTLVTEEKWKAMALTAVVARYSLQKMVADLHAEGKTICGYGASAKSTVWVNACGFRKDDIAFITDTTPQKIGRFTPGTKIPIVDEAELLVRKPDYAVMFAWNYFQFIMQKNKAFLDGGGKFIVPVPTAKIVEHA